MAERRPAPPGGFTLVESIVAAALIGACLLTIISVIPSGVLSLKKAEDLEAATAYGMEVLEMRRARLDPGEMTHEITMNATRFDVVSRVDEQPHPGGHLYDFVVTVSWNRQPCPVRLATRLFRP